MWKRSVSSDGLADLHVCGGGGPLQKRLVSSALWVASGGLPAMFDESFVLCEVAHRTEKKQMSGASGAFVCVGLIRQPIPQTPRVQPLRRPPSLGDWAIDVGVAQIRMGNITAEIDGGPSCTGRTLMGDLPVSAAIYRPRGKQHRN